MRKLFLAIAAILLGLSDVSQAAGRYPDPIPGSLTYHGQPRSKLKKAPVGSIFQHQFRDQFGYLMIETYRIQPDRSLLLIERHEVYDMFDHR
ncbi:hypothetical protein [Sinorhizobium sp. BG8]|uniref:hypothetical protein n=1 Tax=Sinorhizobium sp. BG8 TaxID=2613773 RepID=UPI00193D2310|nr:hypothetical protein [Sinorhizobium sp. BG8]QRM54082.1 hypothetical protein F3Y30_05600 [Sinorhizobium sp. BG8]